MYIMLNLLNNIQSNPIPAYTCSFDQSRLSMQLSTRDNYLFHKFRRYETYENRMNKYIFCMGKDRLVDACCHP